MERNTNNTSIKIFTIVTESINQRRIEEMQVTVYEDNVKISNEFVIKIVNELFAESYYMWQSEWFRKDQETETLFAKKVIATETIVFKALEQYLNNNK